MNIKLPIEKGDTVIYVDSREYHNNKTNINTKRKKKERQISMRLKYKNKILMNSSSTWTGHQNDEKEHKRLWVDRQKNLGLGRTPEAAMQ